MSSDNCSALRADDYSLITLMSTDDCFKRLFIEFASSFNPNVDWDELVKLWIQKHKTNEQLYSLFRSITWIDKSIDWEEDFLSRYITITDALVDFREKSIVILDYRDVNSITAEREMESYREVLIEYLTARGIGFEFKPFLKLKKNDYVFDYGWFFLSAKELSILYKMKNRIHFKFLGLDVVPAEYVPALCSFYLSFD